MTARDRAVEVLRERRGSTFPSERAISDLEAAGLAVVHAGTVVDRDIVLDRAEEALRSAVAAQRADRDPHHGQFYAWGWLLTVLAEQADSLAQLLAEQLGDYGQVHQLRDDASMPPGQRVERAVDALDHVVGYARVLRQHAAQFHSEVGHIAVEQSPEPEGGEPT